MTSALFQLYQRISKKSIVKFVQFSVIAYWCYFAIIHFISSNDLKRTLLISPMMLIPLAPFLTNAIPLCEAILCLIMVLGKTRAIGMFIAFFVQYYFTIYLIFVTV
jgi:hypothetical protein